jgi:nicotinamidase-related amidase
VRNGRARRMRQHTAHDVPASAACRVWAASVRRPGAHIAGCRLVPLELSALPQARTVLLLIDLINPMQFDGAEQLSAPAVKAAAAVAALKRDAAARGVPAVYVNDNFGHWRSDFHGLVTLCRRLRGTSGTLARMLAPHARDFTVLKPRHSGFHATPLGFLLERMDTRHLVITGLATDLCVQFTAMDAFLRGYSLWVPADCTAAETPARQQAALKWMALALKSHIRPSRSGGS